MIATKQDPAAEPRAPDHRQDNDLARHPDAAIRRQLAARADARPELLYYLAEDDSPEVRREIAANPVTPIQAQLLLAEDIDESVRAELAERIARLAPGLTDEARAEARRRVVGVIEMLARDQATRVRRLLAEALKDCAQVPPSLIRHLAHDAEAVVAAPVLQFSPLLSDEDLIEIIGGRPASAALVAIAARPSLGATVADAIVASDDTPAVAALLANPSAQIREETLDAIIDRASLRPSWHGPLVDRPGLSGKAVRRIASFVAEELLSRLTARGDLDAATRAQLAGEVRRRLAAQPVKASGASEARKDPEAEARRLHAQGRLDGEAVGAALESGQGGFVRAALALLAGVSPAVVDKILRASSAKAVTALAWKAGLTPRLAVQLQLRLGGIPPRQLLSHRAGLDWPLTPDEMTWNVEFFGG